MTTRADIVAKAQSFNNLNDGTGYPGPENVFETTLGRPVEFWCADFVTAVYEMCGLPLPVMQEGLQGKQTGFSFVPDGWSYAQAHGAAGDSWNAEPGDFIIIATDQGAAGHVELVTSLVGDTLSSIGGDSGPDGGVNEHTWITTAPAGNAQITGLVKAGALVTFAADAPPPPPPSWHLPITKESPPYAIKSLAGALSAHGYQVSTLALNEGTWDSSVSSAVLHLMTNRELPEGDKPEGDHAGEVVMALLFPATQPEA